MQLNLNLALLFPFCRLDLPKLKRGLHYFFAVKLSAFTFVVWPRQLVGDRDRDVSRLGLSATQTNRDGKGSCWHLCLQLVHVSQEFGVVADLFETADQQLHGFDWR